MTVESAARSIKMLKAILDGKTYVAVAQESGLSRSAVEQRVKALARDLQTVVGVERVDEDEVPTVQGDASAEGRTILKRSSTITRNAWSNAAKRPRALPDEDIERAVAVIRQHSNCRKRDTALLLVLFSTAAKPLEIARLEVQGLPDRRRVGTRGIADACGACHQRQGKAALLRQHQGRRGSGRLFGRTDSAGAGHQRRGRSTEGLTRTAGCF